MAEKSARAASDARGDTRSDRRRADGEAGASREREKASRRASTSGRPATSERSAGGARGTGGTRGKGAAGGARGSRRDDSPAVSAPNATGAERRWVERNAAELSRTTLRAKWIHGDERPDRNGQTLATRHPDVIRRWADERGGTPAAATRAGRDGRPRTLRIDFPAGGPDGRLEPVSWEEWLAVFRERDLVFLFQERLRNGNQSNFFRLDSPRRERG